MPCQHCLISQINAEIHCMWVKLFLRVLYRYMEQKGRLAIEIAQVKGLLGSFRRQKMKCLELSELVNKDVPNLERYEVMEVTCTRKINKMDLLAVIQLKEQVASSIKALQEFEGQVNLQIKMKQQPKPKPAKKVLITKPAVLKPIAERQEDLGPYRIPQYNIAAENNEKKLDKMCNFITNLGKSMWALRRNMLSDWDEEAFRMYEPECISQKVQMERFKMRNEELTHIAKQRLQEEISSMMKKGKKVVPDVSDDEDEYQTVKISKKSVQEYNKKLPKQDAPLKIAFSKPVSMLEPKRAKSYKHLPSLGRIREQKRVENVETDQQVLPVFQSDSTLNMPANAFKKRDFTNTSALQTSFDEEDGQKGNYVYMMKKRDQDSDVNTSILSSISSLRSLRQKVFDDDIWDEFDKI